MKHNSAWALRPNWLPCLSILLLSALNLGTPVCAAAPDADEIILVGGRIITQTAVGVVEGSVLIRNGTITGVGSVDVPSSARRIDISGMTVTPGLIDARSCLWLQAAAAREGANDGGLDARDGVDPFSEDWREVVRQGVTAVYVQPAATGTLGGRGAVLRVGPGRSIEELVIKADAGAQAALGAVSRSTTSRDRYAQFEQLKSALTSAKQYDETWKKYEAAQRQDPGKNEAAKEASKTSNGAAKRSSSAPNEKPPPRESAKDFLRKVLQREVPLRIEAHADDSLLKALQLADEFSIRVVLDGVSQPLASLEGIQARRTPLVLGPVLELEETPEYRARRPQDWLRKLVSEDIRWALATFGQHPLASRMLRVQAAAAVSQGVPPDRVLRAMTQHAAAILGVEDKLGSIAAGKQADLAVFAGDPLDPSVSVRMVVSQGKVVYESEAPMSPAPHNSRSLDVTLPKLPPAYALKSLRCWTEAGALEPRTILVVDGRVAAIETATSVVGSIPSTVPVVDVGSAVVTPGLVIAHSDLKWGKDIDETVDADASYLRAIDVFDPSERKIRQVAQDGFLGLAYAPGSANVLAGSVGLVRPGAGDPIRTDFLAGKFVLTADSRNSERYPVSLAGQYELIDQALSSMPLERQLFVPELIQDQLEHERRRHLEALLSRQKVAMFAVRTEAEIGTALILIGRYKLRAVLVGPEKFEPLLPDLKRLGVGIIARPIRTSDYDRYVATLVEASRAGIPIAFGLGSGDQIRITAALAVNAGMARESALLALTQIASQMLGMPGGIGRIETGTPADLVVWNGSPLDPASRPLHVILDGKRLDLDKPRTQRASPTEDRIARQAE